MTIGHTLALAFNPVENKLWRGGCNITIVSLYICKWEKNIHHQELPALIHGLSLLVPGKYQDVPGSTSKFSV